VRYYLYSGRGSGSPAPVWEEAGESHGWPAVGLVGPGPDYVTVPSTAPRGTYRLSTGPISRDGACALLTIGTTPISRMLGDSGKGATWLR
jgi:hypothetical protein